MIKAHLLLVDSDPLSLGTLVDTFRAEPGISFHAAKNLEEARNILRDPAAAFDLMVLDCLMPGRGGLDPLHRLRADQRLAGMPIILQTRCRRAASKCARVPPSAPIII